MARESRPAQAPLPLGPASVYKVTATPSSLEEGNYLSITVEVDGQPLTSLIAWSLSGEGISASDFSPRELFSTQIPNEYGSFTLPLIARDNQIEADEILEIRLLDPDDLSRQLGETLRVSIRDQSQERSNRPPSVLVRATTFQPGEIVNIASTFDALFAISDPDGDAIVSYLFELTEPRGGGLFRRRGEPLSEATVSIAASELAELDWIAGPAGSVDGLRVLVTDARGATSAAAVRSSPWRSLDRNRPPQVTLQSQTFLPGEVVNIAAHADRLLAISDPDGDAIVSYAFQIRDPQRDGVFSRNGVPLASNTVRIAASDLADLNWIAGPAGSVDAIRVRIRDARGAASAWSAGPVLWSAATPNRAPEVHTRSLRLQPGAVIDVASDLQRLVRISDPEGDAIVSYSFRVRDGADSGYFSRNGEPISRRQFSLSAESLDELRWHAGPAGSVNGIRIRVTDARGATSLPPARTALWRTLPPGPRLRLNAGDAGQGLSLAPPISSPNGVEAANEDPQPLPPLSRQASPLEPSDGLIAHPGSHNRLPRPLTAGCSHDPGSDQPAADVILGGASRPCPLEQDPRTTLQRLPSRDGGFPNAATLCAVDGLPPASDAAGWGSLPIGESVSIGGLPWLAGQGGAAVSPGCL